MREQHEDEKHLTLVRVVAPHFVAGLETDGTVRRAPILHYMVGWPDDRVRAYVKEQGWKASVVAEAQHQAPLRRLRWIERRQL